MKNSIRFIILFMSIALVSYNNTAKILDEKVVKTSENNFKLANNPIGYEIIEAHVDYVSSPFKANDKFNLFYELSIVNSYKHGLVLDNIDVVNTNSRKTIIKNFDNHYLQNNFIFLGKKSKSEKIVLEPGEKAIVNLQMVFDASEKIPKKVFHRLQFIFTKKDGSFIKVPFEIALTEIPKTNTITIGLPFHKGKWFYTAQSHKNSRLITYGKPSFAQRFAIDWAFIKKDGVFVNGDQSKNSNYSTYGQEILAVSDGVVKKIKNEFPDNIPEQLDIKINRESITGNYLVLDIGNNINAVYAHLIPNKFKVVEGEMVKKGQVIGYLGNSGNSDGPHLHFHLETNSPMVLGGEGVPYYFEKFKQLKSFSLNEIEAMFESDKLDLTNLILKIRINQMPIGNGIIEFE